MGKWNVLLKGVGGGVHTDLPGRTKRLRTRRVKSKRRAQKNTKPVIVDVARIK